ncbi:MAG: putative metal-dependent hydrolase YfiT [Chloroflexi bacterium OLB15]|nr:MAG: putative metal-dependent hydrolase YfiT [Chloroflexi bacterium OLB15]
MFSANVFTPAKCISRLGQNLHILRSIVERISQKEALQLRDGNDGWNTVEIISHLADWDGIYATRIRNAVTEDRPMIVPYDPLARFESQGYATRTLSEALLWLTERRTELIDLLRSLESEQWLRKSIHPDDGEMSIYDIAYNVVLHDINHIEQIFKALE